jgi:4-hydroxy-tetrahydrodipicolinate reductase
MSGCNGRMGKAIVSLAKECEKYRIVAGFDAHHGKDNDFPVYSDLDEIQEKADVMIDFSHISATLKVLDYCKRNKLPLVLATTGIAGNLEKEVLEAAKTIPIFKSFNTSLGISLLMALVRQAAKVLGDSCDIEIVEKHHNQKLDSPSGTALMIADAARTALNYEPTYIYGRGWEHRKRSNKEIGIHAVRGGRIIGEHEISFIGNYEIITISHSALSRRLFAEGALKAAEFIISNTTPGIYNMDDLVASLTKK